MSESQGDKMDIAKMLQNALAKKQSCLDVPAGTVLINVNGSSEKSEECPNCGAWINHWHELSGEEIPDDGDCSIKDCKGLIMEKEGKPQRKQVIDGCHVKIKGRGNTVYIAPLCHGCNTRPDGTELTLQRGITLVKANVQESCGKLSAEG